MASALAGTFHVCKDCQTCAHGSDPCFTDVQAALDAAPYDPNGVEIIIHEGVYVGPVVIEPKDTGGQDGPYSITLRAEDPSAPPVLLHGAGPPSDEENAVIRIENEMDVNAHAHCDFRVAIQYLRVAAIDEYTSALAVISSLEDVQQYYATRLDIEGNAFKAHRSGGLGQGGGAVWIGRRPDRDGGFCDGAPDFSPCLTNQSLKWGIIRDNDIVTIDPNGPGSDGSISDAMSCFHFVGLIENNRVTSTGEGMHLGYSFLDTQKVPECLITSSLLANTKTIVRHNAFACNEQNGLHVTHGSVAKVHNNIFHATWFQEAGHATGIEVGPASFTAAAGGDTSLPEFNNGTLANTEIEIDFNTVDWNEGIGVSFHPKAHVTSLQGNIFSRCDDEAPYHGTAKTYGVAYTGDTFDPDKFVDPNFNLYWLNRDASGVLSDYNYPALYDDGLRGANDVNEGANPDNSDPHFEGERSGGPAEYSYVLQSTTSDVCGHGTGTADSKAMDAGPTNEDDGEFPPGQGFARSDAGAYGGSHNVWDWTGGNACLEYDKLHTLVECRP